MSVAETPYVIAVIGAGPSGIYAAEALIQQAEVPVEIVVIDRLPVPSAWSATESRPIIVDPVDPQHAGADPGTSGVRFYGDVTIGPDLQIDELRQLVDAVIYAYGAGSDRRLGIPAKI